MPVTLPGANANASGIAVVNNDVYVIGKRSPNGTSSIVCYWKNGQLTDITNSSTYAIDQDITVSGTDIYMAWSATYNSLANYKPAIQKTLERR